MYAPLLFSFFSLADNTNWSIAQLTDPIVLGKEMKFALLPRHPSITLQADTKLGCVRSGAMPNIALRAAEDGMLLLCGTPSESGKGSFSCTIDEENVEGSPFQGCVVRFSCSRCCMAHS